MHTDTVFFTSVFHQIYLTGVPIFEIIKTSNLHARKDHIMSRQHYWYLNSKHEAIHVDLLKQTHYSRTVRPKEGDQEGKEIVVHPEGVAHGRLYPRLFVTSHAERPDIFVAHHRAMMVQTPDEHMKNAVPTRDPKYRLQSFIADVIDSIHEGENVILSGGTGVGKTTHILQLAANINQPVLRINFNGETRMADLLGKVHVINGETRWVDGVLPMAMRHGYWLILDELDFAEPAVLSLLHPVLEEDSMLVLKENNGEIIHRHPKCRIFGTSNSIGGMQERSQSYGGTNEMNEAFLDRWQVIMVDNLKAEEELKVLRNKVPALKPAWAKRMVEFANKVRSRDDSVNVYSGDNFSTRKLLAWAKKAALHNSPLKGADIAWLGKLPSADEKEALTQVIQTIFGGKSTLKKMKR